MHPDIPNVFFIGLLQPLGAIMPLAEAQGAWVGDYLLGDYVLPSQAELRADIAADQAAMRERYVASKRHTIQVDFDDYLHDARQRAPGGRRAGARERLPSTGAMPTFCRHNRFVERCPICSKTLPGNEPAARAAHRRAPGGVAAGARAAQPARARVHGGGLRVRRERRAADDGYRCELVPGLRASRRRAPAGERDRLLQRAPARAGADPPGLYGEVRELAADGPRAGHLGAAS